MQPTIRIPWLFGACVAAGLAATASAQITIGPATTAFVDISSTGTPVGAITDDSENSVTAAQLTGAGFTGNQLLGALDILVGNNGAVIWNSTIGEVGYINSTAFITMAPSNQTTTGNGGLTPGQQFVCPLWDDNTPGSGAGCVWQVVSGNLILQWTNEDHFNAPGVGTVTYELIVYGGVTIASGLPLVAFVYNDTLYTSPAYQNDGGSATIGYKNWGVVAAANDVQFGIGGGTDTLGDPAYNGTNMRPKVGGWLASADVTLPHAVVIRGANVAPAAYCTSGTTTHGCLAAITANNNYSVAHATSCNVSVANVEGQKFGILFYGINNTGFTPSSWAAGSNSFLCVKSPSQRTGTQNSNGTDGQCDGVLALDFNAYSTAHPSALGQPYTAGQHLYWQAWFRDPPAPKTTNLSNGLDMTVVP